MPRRIHIFHLNKVILVLLSILVGLLVLISPDTSQAVTDTSYAFCIGDTTQFGKALYSIETRNAGGCYIEFQSNTTTIKETALSAFLKICTICPTDSAYYQDFPFELAYDFSDKINDRSEYIHFVNETLNTFALTITKLKKYPFETTIADVHSAFIKNYMDRYEFERISLEWLKNDDFDQFQNAILQFHSDTETDAILNVIKNQKTWKDKYNGIIFNLYRHLNDAKFSFDLINTLQVNYLQKYDLRFIYDPECDC